MKTTTWIIIILIVLIGGYFLLTPQEPVDKGPIKIGALLVLSGNGAFWGENARDGINFAIKESGVDVELIIEDTHGEAKTAISGFKKLTEINKVDLIIGPLLQTEIASISPIINNKIPVVAPSYTGIKDRPNPKNPLMIWMDPNIEAERMAIHVFNKGVKSVGVIGTKDLWENTVSDAFSNKFKELGGNVVEEVVQPDTSDIRSSITKILANKPEAIFIGTYFQFIQSVKELKGLKYSGELYSIEVDSYLAEQTKGDTENMEFISLDLYKEDFVERFEKEYGRKPGIPVGQAYDATMIALSLFEKSRDKDVIISEMEKINKYNGVSGEIVITDDYKTLLPTTIFKTVNGEIIKTEE